MNLLDTRTAKDLKEELEILATNIDMLRVFYERKLRTETQELKKELYLQVRVFRTF